MSRALQTTVVGCRTSGLHCERLTVMTYARQAGGAVRDIECIESNPPRGITNKRDVMNGP